MSSRRKRSKQPEPHLTFFLDQGLGRYDVSAAVTSCGFVSLPAHKVYPDAGHTPVDDDVWIRRCVTEGWIALTKDTAILRHHKDVLEGSGLRIFAFDSAKLTGQMMAERFSFHAGRIAARSRQDGPFVDVLHTRKIERRWPK